MAWIFLNPNGKDRATYVAFGSMLSKKGLRDGLNDDSW
jgi:hypothetical protein